MADVKRDQWAKLVFELEPSRPPPAVPAQQSKLTVNSNVTDDRMYIDGQPIGSTRPWPYEVAPGIHTVRVEAFGYESAEKTVTSVAGASKTLKFVLQPLISGSCYAGLPALSTCRDTLRDGSKGPEMVVIPAGRFTMGSPDGEPDRAEQEGPQHEVRFTRSFAFGKFEVTFDQYELYCDATAGCKAPDDKGWGRGNRPVVNVYWKDAKAYAQWLSKQTGKRYRLPSEAEWEYATRAGTTGPFSFKGPITDKKVNYNANYMYEGSPKGKGGRKTMPVGSLPANPWGLHEVHGNVWEWVQDCWHSNYKGAPDDGRAWLEEVAAGDCGTRVVRGGSLNDDPEDLRSAYRSASSIFWGIRTVHQRRYRPEVFRSYYIGFRLAQDIE